MPRRPLLRERLGVVAEAVRRQRRLEVLRRQRRLEVERRRERPDPCRPREPLLHPGGRS